MPSGHSLPQINLGVQGGIQGILTNSITEYPPAYLLFGLLPYQSPIDYYYYHEPVDEARELALQRTIDYHIKNPFDESLSSFESDEDFVHSISSSEDDTSDEENFSSVRQWCKIDSSSPAPSRFSFTGDVGMKACVTNISDPLEYFELFFTDEIVNHIVTETNIFAAENLNKFKSKEHSRTQHWSETNANELRVFFATLILQGIITKPTFGLAIHQNDHQARRRFVEWAQNEIAVVPDFHKRILFSDEAHFWLNGYVNKQNCRIWSEANLQVYVETPLHPEKLTVWCALWAGGIIGPYFFKNDEGHNVTVNGDRYRAMITNFFIPELNNHDVQELWFQQDGATCHKARATIDLWKDTIGDRLISRFGPVNWPPRSCDLTPLD
ncbi:piggyBac transposable element-derived protein 4 [Trichonephila clavipes]|uniref:PiggyBac transposable element-derived protein 4 n=1 Tax=Trichonephila clavipes TaxID=2585209 RepID=A0A8X7BJT9_TRICX|nr:piggyBac transposable element-derived protein 4 [Trichonephila clavipes]